MANTTGEKELKTNWPIVTGLTAVSKHEGRQSNLLPTDGSTLRRRELVGID